MLAVISVQTMFEELLASTYVAFAGIINKVHRCETELQLAAGTVTLELPIILIVLPIMKVNEGYLSLGKFMSGLFSLSKNPHKSF